METNPDFKEYLETLKDEADKCYYVAPSLLFLTGVALGLTPADPTIGLLDILYVDMLLVGTAWFISRAIKKRRAEKKYQAAFDQYYKEFIGRV